MERKRPSRFRYTWRYGIIGAVLIVLILNVLYTRQSNVVTLGYGDFKQILQAPERSFRISA